MNRLSRTFALLAACLFVLAVAGQAPAAKTGPVLDYYSATISHDDLQTLAAKGVDVAAARKAGQNLHVDLVLSPQQLQTVRGQGVEPVLVKNAFGRTARQEAAHQAAAGYTVWRDFDGPDGIKAQLQQIAAAHPQIAHLETLGTTAQGRPILALQLTKGNFGLHNTNRPSVLFSATQHAREWIATETDMRILKWYVGKYDGGDAAVKKLLTQEQLWFVPVMNPDGYQYTFLSPSTRLWRKNLRDNNGNGTTEVGDGVDPNRNYANHWNYDEEGSSSVQSSDTYRGPSAASEPETTAMQGFLDTVQPKFQVNFHSFGPYLLYPEGWQVSTPTADDPIYYALSGNLDTPAIAGFNPGLSSDVLYVTNGESTDYAHTKDGTLAWTPELEEGCTGCGFVFPDDEALVQAEFLKVLPFAQDVVASAPDPANPVSHLGITTKPFYWQSDDTYKAGVPLANFKFAVSYGDPQEVRILAKRYLGKVDMKYRINGGPVKTDAVTEYDGGKRYGGKTDFYYHVVSGRVKGTSPGDSVEVWFESPKATSSSMTYHAAVESKNKVLIVAAEDYTGASPVQTAGPHYLQSYVDALTANGIKADVYDVDANGRKAPDDLGVLSHYGAVIWYTGDDTVTREPGWGPGNASRLAMDELLNMREYLNEGGRVLFTGKNAGAQFSPSLGTQSYDPTAANAQCSALGGDPRRCLVLAGSGDGQNDVVEYWFGAYLMNYGAGVADDGSIFNVLGSDNPFTALNWSINGPASANNQTVASSFITTSGILPVATYPQFKSWPAAKYDRPGGPFVPHTGTSYVYSQIADVSYKRLLRTVTVPATGTNELSFWTSYNTEANWDHLFVEVHTVGQNDWTTLPDLNGHTTQATGESCKAENSGGWRTLHPFLDHYQTQSGTSACLPTGTTGAWNAASGDSGGWQQWRVSLAAYAGKQVEVSISYASDWATQGLGVFVDDVTLPDGTSTSFETGLDGWTMPSAPPGDAPNANTWIRTTSAGFPEGAVVATDDTLYFGFGFEGIATAASRNAVMGRAMSYLLR